MLRDKQGTLEAAMSAQESDNPFQSPATISDGVDAGMQQEEREQDNLGLAIAVAALRWSLICGMSAIPSWWVAYRATPAVIGGMVTGIIIFVIGYTIFDVRTRNHPLRERFDVKTTLRITYGTRIAISILFPVGFIADVFCGIIAVGATDALFQGNTFGPRQGGFASTLVTTLIQGVLLNCVLAGYGLFVYGLCRLTFGNRSASNTSSRS